MAAPVDVKPVTPIAVNPVPQEVISKPLKVLLVAMLEQICVITCRIDMSDPTIRSSLDTFRVVLKNLEAL